MLREVKDVIEACAAQRTALVVLNVAGFAAPAMANLLLSLGCDAAVSKGKGTNEIAEFNRSLLESSGAALTDWGEFNTKWLASPKATEFLNRALELLETEFGGSYLSVVQDTGTARLLPFWNIVFDRAGIIPRYLVIVSDPAQAVGDLHERLSIESGVGQLIWLRSVLDAEAQSRGKLRAFVDAARLSEDPATSVNSLAETLQLTFPRAVESVFASEDACIQEFRELLRRSEEKPMILAPAATVEWVRVTHEILKDWAVSGERADLWPVLDALREAFDEAGPIFLGISSDGKNGEVRELQQQLEMLRTETLRAEEDARTSIINAETRARFVEDAAKEAQKELKGRISQLESALAQRTAEVDETWDSLRDARTEISSAKQELQGSRLEIAELRKASAETGQALEEAEEQLRARYSEIVTLTRMLATETSTARKFERTTERLAGISRVFQRGATKGVAGRLGRILPRRWQLRRIKHRLEREGLFDSDAYLRANPDVQAAGADPLGHYLTHGALEGRPLGIN
jgi:hypothetical protein